MNDAIRCAAMSAIHKKNKMKKSIGCSQFFLTLGQTQHSLNHKIVIMRYEFQQCSKYYNCYLSQAFSSVSLRCMPNAWFANQTKRRKNGNTTIPVNTFAKQFFSLMMNKLMKRSSLNENAGSSNNSWINLLYFINV